VARGDFASGRGLKVEGSGNSPSWRDRAEELEGLLEMAEAEKGELQSRLDEIASIAAPDMVAREERIDETLAEIKAQIAKQAIALDRLVAGFLPLVGPPEDQG
jgi:hypothetical protein